MLLKIRMDYMSNDACDEMWRPFNVTRHASIMCATGGTGYDTCTGDSGGPLFTLVNKPINRQMQFAVAASGLLTCDKYSSMSTRFTRVAPYMEWILDTIGQPLY